MNSKPEVAGGPSPAWPPYSWPRRAVSACSPPRPARPPGPAPGVTATSISTGAISTLTGPLASNFESLVPGIQAYFDMVNAKGGINGRKLRALPQPRRRRQPEPVQPAGPHRWSTRTTSSPSSAWPPPSSPPTTSSRPRPRPTATTSCGNWAGPPNLFAAGGSVQYYPAGALEFSYLVQHLKSKSVAVVAYGIASSQNSCKATIQGFKDRGINVSYTDLNIPYPASGVSLGRPAHAAGQGRLVI